MFLGFIKKGQLLARQDGLVSDWSTDKLNWRINSLHAFYAPQILRLTSHKVAVPIINVALMSNQCYEQTWFRITVRNVILFNHFIISKLNYFRNFLFYFFILSSLLFYKINNFIQKWPDQKVKQMQFFIICNL